MRIIQVGGVITYHHQGPDALRHAKRLDRAFRVMEEFGHGSGPHISVIETNDIERYPYPNAKIIWENH